MKLYGFFRSAAAYRVRIALNLKGLPVEHASLHLRSGQQRAASYLELNPQGLVPALVLDDGRILTQSIAIIEWLETTYPSPPLLPKDPLQLARVRAFAFALASDTHPLQNLRVLGRLREEGLSEDRINTWAAWINADGLGACEQMIADEPGPFCYGPEIGLADICLVPQLGNARRFGVDVARFPRLLQAERAAKALPAVQDAAPERQADAE